MVLLTATCGWLTTAVDTTHTVCGVVKASVVYLMLSDKLSVLRNQIKYLSDEQNTKIFSSHWSQTNLDSSALVYEQEARATAKMMIIF